jgi:hypothetical protein
LDFSQFDHYIKNGFQLIPLFSWDHTTTKPVAKIIIDKNGKKRKVKEQKTILDGKRPLHSSWPTKPYDNKEVLKLAKKGHNLGVRLTANLLIVDVDPRNYPKDAEGKVINSFTKFCKDTKFDPNEFPCVNTGGGGFHFYTLKDPDVAIVDTLEDYRGIEFKTLGRQVVAAGSIHPETEKLYRWAFTDDVTPFAPGLDAIKPLPNSVLSLIKRPTFEVTHHGEGGGEHTQEEIAQMLEALDPTDYNSAVAGPDKWLHLMMACHHASGGEARQEFIDWSTQDPQYADDAFIIGRRWDSLHFERPGALRTYRSLHKELREAGKADCVIRPSAAEDFADDLEEIDINDTRTLVPENERENVLFKLNRDHAIVMDGGKAYVSKVTKYPVGDKKGKTRDVYEFMTMTDFALLKAPLKIEGKDAKGNATALSAVKEWTTWPNRRTYQGVIFHPEYQHKDFLNRWLGWSVRPKPGDWSIMRDMIFEVLCDGDKEAFEYLLNWCAYMVQHPSLPAEVAICFYGDKGTGKSTLGYFLTCLAEQHSFVMSQTEHLVGKFNSHLKTCIFVFSDEAIAPRDQQAINALQAMITSRNMTYEKKGQEIGLPSMNMLHIMIASNLDKFIPAGLIDGERRYFIMKVNNKRRGQKEYWTKLYDQMEREGGLEAMFYELLNRDIKGWAPRHNIPKTKGLLDQQLRGMTPEQEFWFNALLEGQIAGSDFMQVPLKRGIPSKGKADWRKGPVRIFVEDFRDSFADYCRMKGLREAANNRAIPHFFFVPFKKMCPKMDTRKKDSIGDREGELQYFDQKKQAASIELPSLAECRKAFEEVSEQIIPWEDFEIGELEEVTENEEQDPFRLED